MTPTILTTLQIPLTATISTKEAYSKMESNQKGDKEDQGSLRLLQHRRQGQGKDKLIMAIIDENVKAVDGSRVRLRLLDDIEIGDETIKKGTYLYATMSGFGKQRVQGKVESIFYDDDIIKVSLSIYDTDGMQGLYVPLSSFRETTKEVASSAMQGGNIMDNTTTSSSGIKGWATQAAQNASQRVMNALGRAAKKNRVRLKYGTRVYLVDGSLKERSNRNRNNY